MVGGSKRMNITPQEQQKKDGAVPFATDSSARDYVANCAELEARLMKLSSEKSLLESELNKIAGSGKTIGEKHRKNYAERRIDQLSKEMSGIRMQLRPLR
ncbi:hypothetical protein CYMTET_14054 [Cymbomonas tetramitiformis]|uniref:Uncharacterized protein n=1 Tax=Cymbomonas tetramitiformis TaxID=36881 RepID=A0AAE0GH94_9CHLO|nr:hypothetical protein CYMTET_14054 [Cymbomonas tetramitiformis]